MANITIGGLTREASVINDVDNLIMYNSTEGTQKITGATLLGFIQNNLFYNVDEQESLDTENDFFLIYSQTTQDGVVYKKLSFQDLLDSIDLSDLVNRYLSEHTPEIKVSVNPEDYLGAGEAIPKDANLNNYIQVGRYYNNGTNVTNGPFDYPVSDPTYLSFNMIVEQLVGNYIRQTIRPVGQCSYTTRDIEIEEPDLLDRYTLTEDETPDENKTYYKADESKANIVLDTDNEYVIQTGAADSYNSDIPYYILQTIQPQEADEDLTNTMSANQSISPIWNADLEEAIATDLFDNEPTTEDIYIIMPIEVRNSNGILNQKVVYYTRAPLFEEGDNGLQPREERVVLIYKYNEDNYEYLLRSQGEDIDTQLEQPIFYISIKMDREGLVQITRTDQDIDMNHRFNSFNIQFGKNTVLESDEIIQNYYSDIEEKVKLFIDAPQFYAVEPEEDFPTNYWERAGLTYIYGEWKDTIIPVVTPNPTV